MALPSTPSCMIDITQHAHLYDCYYLARPPVRLILPSTPTCTIDITQHALKGQKLLAQGIALGIKAISNAPCKGKSFKIHRIKMVTPLRYVKLLPVVLKLLPLQGARFATHKKPRALPWEGTEKGTQF